nr:protein Frey 1 [Globicephala melas]
MTAAPVSSGRSLCLPLPLPGPQKAVLLWERSVRHQPALGLTPGRWPQRSVPEEFSAPLELLEPLSGLVDDYGVRPKHPWPRRPRPLLSRAQQRKRAGLDVAEYYDAHL